MTTIKVTPEQLLSVSKQFATAQSQIAQMNYVLKQQLFEIERQWNGSTKERFYADFIAAQRVMDNFSSLSLSIAKTLEGHAEKFRLADQQTTQSYDANCMPPPPDECRAPTVDNRNAFQKSVDSLKELGTGFMQAADDRYQKRYDSVGGFLDYWTFGIPSGLVEGYMDRADKAFNSANDTANWLTFGIHGTIREAIFPSNAWSSEHWANMMGMGGMMVGGGLTAKMIKPHNLLTSSGGGTKVSVLNQRPGTGQMTGGFNGFKDPRLQVMDNIAESKKARESSKFSEFVEKEKEIGKGTGSTGYILDPVQMRKYIIVPEDGFQALLERKYIEIRKSGVEDIGVVAKNTNLTEEQILRMKKHLFLDRKQLSVSGKPYEELYFQADADIAYAWQKAQKNALTEKEIEWFEKLANHELKEKQYMDGGMPLRDPSTWNNDTKRFDPDPLKNAHDKANITDPNPTASFPGYDSGSDFIKHMDDVIDY
ncbi:WXG100 family type VII secretion target [Paenibacillus sp. RRE4]|uniref:WXG100 family type VII secretion target n=1 Tax=Paenibacillus sp. RRE4 TaxID=2962587 RepID=UPI0028810EDA|nr:WXG100 family type VII secretion target [Paenibacillus sp. RRE4]MDT0126069.1 WXG100 family type VII secretion target [Paenibacillus sp. RRE4]